jgi:hypothetical protein
MADAVKRQPGDVLMSVWTVYDHPLDFPEHIVARRFEIIIGELEPRPTPDVYLADDVEMLQQHFTRIGLAFLARVEADDPKIMGIWL